MISIKSDFSEKKEEAEILIKHIHEMSSLKGSIHISPILKSALILLLYNMVESTATLVIGKVHESASRYIYMELSEKLKKIFINFYLTNENERNQKKYLDEILTDNLTFPIFSIFENKNNMFSGNLDAREINKIIGKYGVGKITTKNKELLLIIKNKRNKIAHGEDMFKESCRNFTIEELEKMKSATINVLQQLIDHTEQYLMQKRFLS